jgi:NDP-sugar pyrophosphorylase family protein
MNGPRAFIFIKDGERGLLSLAEGRAKSLVPVFGGSRIIDTYLQPLLHAGVERVTVLTGGERTDMKDYFLYRYGSGSVEVAFESDAARFLAETLARSRREGALVLQAESLILIDWTRALMDLVALKEGTHHLRTSRKESIGFFVAEGGMPGGKTSGREAEPRTSGIDGAWERVKKHLEKGARHVELPAVLFPLRTVAEYYKGHFAILRRLREYIGFEQLHPVEEVDERSTASVAASGSVRSSHIGHSCVVEGTVEQSILFPHVRVAKGARVSNSIVMDHNSVGAGALVLNSVVCDNNELFSRLAPNIGEGARVGDEGCAGVNALHPDLINGGITLIGRNVEIPARFTVSRNCYVSSEVGRTGFRGRNGMEAGASIPAPEG